MDSRISGIPNNTGHVRMVRAEFVPWNQDINKKNSSTSFSPQDTPCI